jgi:glycosyltransferase involved in cell wall biosynthesis
MDVPHDRPRIDVPADVPDICAGEIGVEPAIAALRAWKPDVVYVQGVRDQEIEKQLLGLAASAHFVHTYTGTCISGAKTFTRPSVTPCDRTFGWPCLVHYFPRGCGGRSPVTMWRQFTRQSAQLAILRQYDAVLTHSDHMCEEMTRHGVPTNVVAFPVRAQEAPTVPTNPAWRLLFAGRMERLKGARYFLDALPLVAAALHRPLRAVLAGDGTDRSRLEGRARTLLTRTPSLSIEFTGWVTDDRLAALLADTDLLVVPSLWPEPLGSIGPAGAQQGIPAAAFNVGGIAQWLVDGVNGHLAPGRPPTVEGLRTAIVRCLQDPEHYVTLRTGALASGARFTMDRHLSELLPILQRVRRS